MSLTATYDTDLDKLETETKATIARIQKMKNEFRQLIELANEEFEFYFPATEGDE